MSLVGAYAPQPYPSAPAADLYYHPAHHHGGATTTPGSVSTMGMGHHGQFQSRYPDHGPDGYFSGAWMFGGGAGGVGGGPADMATADGYLAGPGGHPGDHYSMLTMMGDGPPRVIRVVKRRCTANKKERRRTVSINTAFANLRGCIPNVPSDTKLSKIKTLRLATSYIAYLMDVLNKDDPKLAEGGFKAELTKKTESREERRRREQEVRVLFIFSHKITISHRYLATSGIKVGVISLCNRPKCQGFL